MTGFLQPHSQTSEFSDNIQCAPHDSGRPRTLDFLSRGSFQLSGDTVSGDASNSLAVFSDPISFHGGEQSQTINGPWETLLHNSSMPFSPMRRSIMPTPSGRDIQDTGMENTCPFAQQITSIPADVPPPQSPHHDDFPLSDLDLDIDFSMYLNSPHRPSTASSSICTGRNPGRSVERISISPFRLTDHDDKYGDNREFIPVSRFTAATDQALDPVTEEDSEAELIVSLLLLLKSLVFPHFNTVSQKYEYGKSILSDLFCSHFCEWVCLDVEELLDLYLEESLRSIRKRRTARVQSSLPLGCNLNLNERRQGFECLDRPQRLSNFIEATVATKMRTTFFRYCSTLMGQIVFKVEQGPSNPIGEERVDSNHLITISFMPRSVDRTPGIRVRISKIIGGPAISPQINTFNVVPDDSAIIQCVRKNDLRGIQTLFDSGAASARDVDSRGISLLNVSTAHQYEQLMSLLIDLQYAMYTGCSDVFRLLIQGGASTNECDDYGERTTDIITVVWNQFVDASWGFHDRRALSMEKLKNFEECVAITQLALDSDCAIDSASHRVPCAGPLFALVGHMAVIDASTLVDAIGYLLSIGWDLEETNNNGKTPLLYAAAACRPQVARCLRALVEKGARLDARDEIGRGPLLSALSTPLDISNWLERTFISVFGGSGYKDKWPHQAIEECSRTDDRRHDRDYYNTENVLDSLTPHLSPHIPRSTPSLDDIESIQPVRDQQSKNFAELLMQIDSSMSDTDSNTSSCSEESVSNPEDDGHAYCFDCKGNDVWIRSPSHVLKDRVRIKLKILLEAGCDPNELDNNGQSTNDYARRGLWSQWLWALEKTGYVFDEEQNRWVKRIDSA